MCMCVCKQSEKITYGKEDQQWILLDWAFVILDLEYVLPINISFNSLEIITLSVL